LKVLDAWLPLRKAEALRVQRLAAHEWADGTTEKARAIVAGLQGHGRPTARFVAEQLGASESQIVLWWVESQLADDYDRDNESAAHHSAVRLIVDNALVQVEVADINESTLMEKAIAEARQCIGKGKPTDPLVGAVVARDGVVLASSHRGELRAGEHAEYTALEKKLAAATVAGATVYTTLEPCTTRSPDKIPCAERLMGRKVKRVVIGMLDPNPNICGKGERLLRDHGIVVDRFPHDLIVQLEELNRDFVRAQNQAAAKANRTQ